MASLQGKVAIITGGSRGIGRATTIALCKAGASVVLTYRSDAKSAQDLVEEVGSDKVTAVQADAGSLSGVEKVIKSAVDKYGKIDILIPNAAISPMKDLENTSEEDFDSTYSLNVKGPYFLVQKAVAHMPEGSHIILLSSSLCGSTTVTPDFLLYCSTKGAIEQMVRLLSKDLARKGICVNAVAPGPTATEQFGKGKPEAMIEKIVEAVPLGHVGLPEEVADAIVYFSSYGSRWITGQVIRANGGMV